MKRGTFKPLPGHEPPQAFPGKVVDLSAEATRAVEGVTERRILTPQEFAEQAQRGFRGRVAIGADGDPFVKSARAEMMHVCIRPKETTLRLGPLGVVKLWRVQFVGQGRVWKKPDGSVDLQGVGNLRRVPAPLGTRIGWYLIGAPIFNTRLFVSWLRGRLVTQGAIATKPQGE